MLKKKSSKILVCSKPERCIGCKMCVIQACVVKGIPISFANSFIKVSSKGEGKYSVTLDYGTKTDYNQIVNICPRRCFELS